MATKLTEKAQEGSSYVILVSFFQKTSEDGSLEPALPNPGLTWNLMDLDGSIVNDRLDVPLSSDESTPIVLTGLDLALPTEYSAYRIVEINGTYDSILGENMSIREQAMFLIENLVG